MKGDRRCISIDSLMPTVLQIICGCSLCGGDIGDGGGMGGDCGGLHQVEFILHLFLVIAAILVSLTLEWPLLCKSVCYRAVKFAEAHSARFRCNVVEWLLGGERVEISL